VTVLERWKQVEEIFNAALDRPAGEREAFLTEACGDDQSLRLQVEYYIDCHEQAGDFIESPATYPEAPTQDEVITAQLDTMAGRQIGAYKLVREIGRGGMGAVYLAVRADNQFRQRAAIKLVKRGMDTDFVIRRFRSERQILAGLNHPNIARLLDGGATDDGLPYFVMEYIDGIPIHRYCDTRRLTVAERLNLFRQVCAAAHYAHENQVIHRDIKPGNILVTEDGAPKLLDFGIAKILDPDLASDTAESTVTAMLVMTPEYASPEQARGEQVTAATDQYSLGVLLYELLTGHRPYKLRSRAPHEIARVISEEEPEKPSDVVTRSREITASDGKRKIVLTPEEVGLDRNTSPDELRRALMGGLDDIVMRALRKSPRRRYASTRDFSEDIGRYLQGLPVSAQARATTTQRFSDAETSAPAVTSEPDRDLEEPPISPVAEAAIPKRAAPKRYTWMATVISAAVIALVVAAGLFFYFRSRAPRREAGAMAPSVVVLPFKPKGASETDKLLGVGLADVVTNRLGQIKRLSVRPASASRRYLESDLDPRQIGAELGVEYVISGDLSHQDDRLSLELQAFGLKENKVLWRDTIHVKLTDIATLQNSIALRIHRSLVVGLESPGQTIFAERDTENGEAYQLYLAGRYYMGKRSQEGLNEAVDSFDKAIEKDPKFALAYAGLADCYALLQFYQAPLALNGYQKARENALKALDLDDSLAEAHTSLAYVKFYFDRDHRGAEASFRRAIALNPSYATAHHWLANALSAMRRHDEAIAEIKEAERLDPRSAIIKAAAGMNYAYARRFDQALDECRRALELNPAMVQAHRIMRWVYQAMGRYDGAFAAYLKEKEFSDAKEEEWLVVLAQLQVIGGKREEAQVILKQGIASMKHIREGDYRPFEIAVAYELLGDRDRALEWLAKSEAVRTTNFNYVLVEPRLDGIRSDPRFITLARNAGLLN
jgi:serine/threonine protein kinase/TolB-like protein/Tfp pilus assembly protein PilF